MHRPLVARQCFVPSRVGGVLNQTSVEIRSTVAPPDRSTFTKTTLDSLDIGSCRSNQRLVSRPSACSDGSTSLHQVTDKAISLGRLQVRPMSPPQTPVQDDVAAIRRFKHMHARPPLEFGERYPCLTVAALRSASILHAGRPAL